MKKKSSKDSITYHQREINRIKLETYNDTMVGMAEKFRDTLLMNMTPAEKKFYSICKSKGIILKCQYIIYIKWCNKIKKFYIADFCDIDNRIIFEIDGEYHFTEEQRKKDHSRWIDLKKAGYKVFRISNSDVYAGKTIQLLYNVYGSRVLN